MKKYCFHIVVFLLFCHSLIFGQKVIWKIEQSEFVPLDSVQQVNIVLSNVATSYERTYFYVLVDEGVSLLSAEFFTGQFSRLLEINRTSYTNYYGKSYKMTLPTIEEYQNQNSNSNLILKFKAPLIRSTEIAYAIEFMEDKKVLSASSFESVGDFDALPITNLEFYTDEKKENYSLLLPSRSKMKLSVNQNEVENNLLFNCWINLRGSNNFFINIFDNVTKDTLHKLSINQLGFINIPEDVSYFDIDNRFAGNYGWTKNSILFDSESNEIEVYFNGKLSYSFNYPQMSFSDLFFELNNIGNESVILDEISIIDFGNQPSAIRKNLHYSQIISDSSRVLLKYNFENDLTIQSASEMNYSFHFEDAEPILIKSNPPLFSRLPEIEFHAFESFSEIKWKNKDDISVEVYTLEKSLDGINFNTIISKESEGNPENYYSIIDEKNNDDEIVYYRIHQLNKDGSELYSGVLKVGQAITQSFVLEQNYPNPFNPLTNITIEVVYDSEFTLRVYDLVGNEIQLIHSGYLSKGIHQFEFDGTELPSGIYFMEANSQFTTQAIKMILAK
jgi:hypothetical protein